MSPDFVLSFQPALLTAATLAVLYLWLRKICSPGKSLFLTMTGAFGTMLWPYAYISLETKQTLFILLAGYMGLAVGEIRSWQALAQLSGDLAGLNARESRPDDRYCSGEPPRSMDAMKMNWGLLALLSPNEYRTLGC